MAAVISLVERVGRVSWAIEQMVCVVPIIVTFWAALIILLRFDHMQVRIQATVLVTRSLDRVGILGRLAL